jgi:menaquinone-dependent protoporphyrinogen oxidase
VKEVRDLAGYDAAVIGSAIRMGSWLPEAVAFVKRHRAELSQLPVAIFTCHMNHTDAESVSVEARRAYTAPIRQLVSPRAEACFCGMIERERLNFVDRLMVDAVKKNTGLALGDFRDWPRIEAWADDIRSMLSAVAA